MNESIRSWAILELRWGTLSDNGIRIKELKELQLQIIVVPALLTAVATPSESSAVDMIKSPSPIPTWKMNPAKQQQLSQLQQKVSTRELIILLSVVVLLFPYNSSQNNIANSKTSFNFGQIPLRVCDVFSTNDSTDGLVQFHTPNMRNETPTEFPCPGDDGTGDNGHDIRGCKRLTTFSGLDWHHS